MSTEKSNAQGQTIFNRIHLYLFLQLRDSEWMNSLDTEEKLVIPSLLICATSIGTVSMVTMKIITFAVSSIIDIEGFWLFECGSDELSSLGSQYMCDFSLDSCNWTASVGRMRWIQAQDIDHEDMFFMRLDMSQYFSNDLVTIGQLRYYQFDCPIYSYQSLIL